MKDPINGRGGRAGGRTQSPILTRNSPDFIEERQESRIFPQRQCGVSCGQQMRKIGRTNPEDDDLRFVQNNPTSGPAISLLPPPPPGAHVADLIFPRPPKGAVEVVRVAGGAGGLGQLVVGPSASVPRSTCPPRSEPIIRSNREMQYGRRIKKLFGQQDPPTDRPRPRPRHACTFDRRPV